MANAKTSRKISLPKTELIVPKYQVNEIQTILNSLLSPIIQEISSLSQMVTSILNLINKKEGSDSEKLIKNCEFASSSIATDVTMMASSMHRLTKNYENIKEQVSENQKSIERFYGKLYNVEKLFTTFLKVENNRTMKQLEEQILKKVSNLEQMLLGEFDMKTTNFKYVNYS